MHSAYAQLLAGLALSIVLIYLVIVVNFQSWLDPFIIITALPAALGGISWSLFLTHTTLSVPALTGAIMCMGTATANTILVVAFARDHLLENGDPVAAAIEAGYARIRPVLMTALAMIVGMVPMSFSNTQNAPLGRAVIGGLLVATVTTLLFVPCVFAILHGGKSSTQSRRTRENPHDRHARRRRRPGHRGGFWLLIGVVVAGGLAAYGIWSRYETVASLKQTAEDAALPRVQVVSPKPGPAQRTLTLPGNIDAWYAGADLRPGQRLCVPLVQGLRRAGEGGRRPRDHRHAQPGRAVRGLQGEPRRGGGALQAGRDHRQTLVGAVGDAGGVAAGRRREDGGRRRAEGAGRRRRAGRRALSGV